MKSSTPSPEEKARRSRCRQHVVRAGDVIADRLRRVRADEDRAGIADAAGELLGVCRGDFQMLGRDGIDQRQRFVEVAHQDHRAEIAPGGAGDLCARQLPELALDHGAFDRAGERCVVGDEDRLRARVVLGLRQQDRRRSSPDCRSGRPGSAPRRARRSCRCRPCRKPGVWRRRHRRCPARRSWRPERWSRCRRRAPRSPARRRCEKSRRCRQAAQPRAQAATAPPAGAGTTMARRGTPATLAGTAFISTEDG